MRLFSSLGLVVAPPACEPGEDTSVAVDPRLHHLALGRPLFLTARLPYATGLASSLSGCFLPTGQRYFLISIADVWKVLPYPAQIRCPSRYQGSLCNAFRLLSFG